MSDVTPQSGRGDLADRIRGHLPPEAEPSERRMFGGLAFMVRGKMAVAIIGDEEVMVRLEAQDARRRIESGEAVAMEMRGRPIQGWVRVAPDDDRELGDWVAAGVDYALSLTR